MEERDIKENKELTTREGYKGEVKLIGKKLKETLSFLSQKKVQWAIIFLILILTLTLASSIRTNNLSLLTDSTTGEYIPLALDPYYFLRIAETMNEGDLPEFDPLRKPMDFKYSNEILPDCVVLIYKIYKVFSPEVSLQYVDVISPVIFFILGIIVFFFLIYLLTNSKRTAIISSIFLSFVPSYLYRTMAGFSDHEAIGMFAFFTGLLIYTIALKKIKTKNYNFVFWGLLTGLGTSFTLASWGGVVNFTYMIIPLSFLVLWLTEFRNFEKENEKKAFKYFLFYTIWIISNILFMPLFGFGFSAAIGKIISTSGLVSLFTLGFIFVDYFSKKYLKNIKKIKENRFVFDIIFVIVLGIIFLSIIKGNAFEYILEIFSRLLHPFGEGRVGLTVAENSQPFLKDWIASIGKNFFWFFYLGMLFVGFEIAKKISQKKSKIIFSGSWVILISGLLFSRFSAASILNGTNFLSKFIYFASALLFIVSVIYIYKREKIKINSQLAIIFSWLIFMLVAGRGAIRLFFVVTPFVCFMGGYLIDKVYVSCKDKKEEILKMVFCIALIIIVILAIFGSYNFYKSSSTQAKYTGPSANAQWQNAMEWVRENTTEGSIFLHWWDYGYWVQYLGERPTISDGGHFQGAFRDHLIGRYFLTNPNPDSALSFMKSNDISYILIDQTDIGKYTAYSKIGSDEKGNDRYSWIQPLVVDSRQTQETRNGSLRVYVANMRLDQDIIYESENGQIFLPEGKAGLGAIILEIIQDNGETTFNQPQAVFVYNGNQYNIPLRYLNYGEELKDFGEGINAAIKIIPRVLEVQGSLQIDELGALIYMSPKTSQSLFVQLYLMSDPLNKYSTITLAHSEPDPAITFLKSQGAQIEDFIYYAGEIRGPIKIWGVDYPEEILIKEEFVRTSGEYAKFDDLVVK